MKRIVRICSFGLVIVGIFLLPTITAAKTSDDPVSDFSSLNWIWALFSLIFVAVLAYWATKFLAGKAGHSPGGHLKVAESLFLGPNRHLYLLLVNGKVLLLGSSEHGLTLLQEIDDPKFYEELQKSAVVPQLPIGRFAQLITPLLNGINLKETEQTATSNSSLRLREGLQKIKDWKAKDRGRHE